MYVLPTAPFSNVPTVSKLRNLNTTMRAFLKLPKTFRDRKLFLKFSVFQVAMNFVGFKSYAIKF